MFLTGKKKQTRDRGRVNDGAAGVAWLRTHRAEGNKVKTMGRYSLLFFALALTAGAPGPQPELTIRAANLVYGERNSARCFSQGFLELVRRDTEAAAPERLLDVSLSSDDLFSCPFALLSGEGYFRFTAQERIRLRRYLLRGGFVLASAGCSSAAWDASFREELDRILPEFPLRVLPDDHPVFSFLYRVSPMRLKDGSLGHLEATEVEGRVVLVYSPAGLNDTEALPDCCCCTGNEAARAAELNANIFLYALFEPPR